MHILVTGGAGFIGSHLAEAWVARGASVELFDDLSTGSLDNVRALLGGERAKLTVGSVTDERALAPAVARADLIYHLAAAVGVRLIVERPVHTIDVNVTGTEVLLRLAAAHKTPVVSTSSSEVYGKSNKLPFTEDTDLLLGATTQSRWAYASSKAQGEFLALAHHKENGLPVVIARLFNTVGPRQVGRYGMVVPSFVDQALAGESIEVYGDGEQTRCFCDVVDVVGALVELGLEPRAVGRIFNIGSDEEVSIVELARRVRELTGSESSISFVPYDEAYEEGFEDMRRRVPDLTRIEKTLGYRPSRDLNEILTRVIAARTCSSFAAR